MAAFVWSKIVIIRIFEDFFLKKKFTMQLQSIGYFTIRKKIVQLGKGRAESLSFRQSQV